MIKTIALFNHKGGVSKTTTTFNLGWMLASKGKTVVLVDTDPQCNLTEMVLGYTGGTEFEQFYEKEMKGNLKDGLAPVFECMPKLMPAVECVPVEGQAGLFLLPGHIQLSEYEVMLNFVQGFLRSVETLQDLPGSISCLLNKTAEQVHADYVLIDTSSSLSSINQNLLMTSDFFMFPTIPDHLSVMAIDSLRTILLRWRTWAEKAQSSLILKNATYPFPKITPKFLGTVIQNYRPRGGARDAGFHKWVDEINQIVSSKLALEFQKFGLMLPYGVYKSQGVGAGFCLATIPDINTLIARSQEHQTPIFALTPAQIGQDENALRLRDKFNALFSELADKIIGLTTYASHD